ncbi:MAG TPA: hypothetical protein VMM58_12470 [Bacteroidota bacterium]|nr:hypothetical protein [Bacteroidota bacterium]
MKIAYYGISDARYGGALHERMVLEALREEHTVVWHEIVRSKWIPGTFPSKIPYLWNHRPDADVTLFNSGSLPLVNLKHHKKKVLILHHFNPAAGRVKWLHRKYQERVLRLASVVDVVVVLGEYWRAFFASFPFKNIVVSYTPFHLPVSADHLGDRMKVRRDLGLPVDGRTLVYIGGVTRAKGAMDIYEALGKYDKYFLVGSGEKEPDIPVMCFSGDYATYLKLLYACDVSLCVSRFSEGWNRVAHESLLMRTPVIGTGIAGSGELLVNSGQYLCYDLTRYERAIDHVIENREQYADKAQAYVRNEKFTLPYFNRQWKEIINSLS